MRQTLVSRLRHRLVVPLVLVAAIALASRALADESSANEFGTQDPTVLRLPAAAFTTTVDCYEYSFDFQAYVVVSTSHPCIGGSPLPLFWAPLDLPNGAVVTELTLEYKDTDTTDNISAGIRSFVDGNGNWNSGSSVSSTGSAGTGVATGNPGFTVQPDTTYMVVISQTSSSSQTGFRAVKIGYRRQVSPSPAVATFLDVPPAHQQFRFIEALVAAGITAGCGGNNYCPDQALTRGQMAVFLAVALGLHHPN
jgi:hypothetical protein